MNSLGCLLGRPKHSEEVDSNRCCVCFVTYDDDVLAEMGADWLHCACGHWLHGSNY